MSKFNTFSIWLSVAFILFTIVMLTASQLDVNAIREFYYSHITEFAVVFCVLVVAGFSVNERGKFGK